MENVMLEGTSAMACFLRWAKGRRGKREPETASRDRPE